MTKPWDNLDNTNATPDGDNSQEGDVFTNLDLDPNDPGVNKRWVEQIKGSDAENKRLNSELASEKEARTVETWVLDSIQDNSKLLDLPEEIGKKVFAQMKKMDIIDDKYGSYSDAMKQLRGENPEKAKAIDENNIVERLEKNIASKKWKEAYDNSLIASVEGKTPEQTNAFLNHVKDIAGDRVLSPETVKTLADQYFFYSQKDQLSEAIWTKNVQDFIASSGERRPIRGTTVTNWGDSDQSKYWTLNSRQVKALQTMGRSEDQIIAIGKQK